MNHSNSIKLAIISQLYDSPLSNEEYAQAVDKINDFDVSDISTKIDNKIAEIVGIDIVKEVEELMLSERYQKYLDAVVEAGTTVKPEIDLLVKFFSGDKGVVN